MYKLELAQARLWHKHHFLNSTDRDPWHHLGQNKIRHFAEGFFSYKSIFVFSSKFHFVDLQQSPSHLNEILLNITIF